MLLLTEADVRALLPMRTAIDLVAAAFERLRKGESRNHPRRRVLLPTGSVLHYMAAADGAYFGAKIYSTHPKHGAHFLFLLYGAADARPLALFEANALGQIRTGAASGYATRLLARDGAVILGLIGTGFQARSQLEAMLAVRPIRLVRVWSRSEERRRKFADEMARACAVEVKAADSAERAVRGADIIVTATTARDPVLEAEWIAPGAHINAMGSNQAQRRELPGDLIARAGLIAVDSLEQARLESGDLILALDETGWKDPKIVELKDVARRPSPEAITLFKSNGLAVEDVVAAGYVYERASAERRGKQIPVFRS